MTGVTTTLSGTDGGGGTPSTTFTVADVSNIVNGSVVTQTSGAGALNGLQPTLVTAVDYDNNTVTVDVDPDTSGSATLTFTPPYGDATTDFTFTIDNVGPIDSVSISNPGVGYFVGDVLSVNALDLVQPITYYVKAIQVQHLSFAASTIPAGTFSVGDGFKFPDGTPTSVAITGFSINCASFNVKGARSIPVINAYTSTVSRNSLTLSGYSNLPNHLKLSYLFNLSTIFLLWSKVSI